MIKAKLFMAAFAMSLLFGSFSANALCTGCTWEPIGDFDIVYGSFSATVRWVDPHEGPDGRYFTYRYSTLTGNTMASCQQQLSSVLASPGVSVVSGCQAD